MPLTATYRRNASRFIRQSSFVFEGTVERDTASSISALGPGPQTATVLVDRVYRAKGDLGDQRGQQVTVVLSAQDSSVIGGARRIFFSDPFIYGETIGVRAVGIMDVPTDLPALDVLVGEVVAGVDDDEVREHLAQVDRAIEGAVIDRQPVHDASPLSEHRPEWWVAIISVTGALKGDLSGEVAVRYPNSTDVRWYMTPKPEIGQEAIFLLHRDGLRHGDTEFAILHSTDVVVDPDARAQHRRLI